MVTAPGEQAGPTPQMVPVPETADPAVVKESDTLEPAGLRLNCHSHRPSRLLLGERREWPQPTVVRSTSEASSETRMRTSALDFVGSIPPERGRTGLGDIGKGRLTDRA